MHFLIYVTPGSWWRLFVLVMILFLCVTSNHASSPEDEKLSAETVKIQPESRKIRTLADSIKSAMKSLEYSEMQKIRRQYWSKTLEDIKKISFGMIEQDLVFSPWKELLEEDVENTDHVEPNSSLNNSSAYSGPFSNWTSIIPERNDFDSVGLPRFEGFLSWERMLLEWAEEVQEYLQQAERDSSMEYMLSNYGRPYKSNGTTIDLEAQIMESTQQTVDHFVSDEEETSVRDEKEQDEKEQTRPTRKRVVPAPLKYGELALPHTDLSDKSKKIEIVTTASLPWKTGTAVNPLLRAAYLLEGRKEAGGSVTLSLPWLERRADQERVYGSANVFDTPQDQEAYIRTWLRESANMPQASHDLRIRWYTAWQNPTENSIYSMGDITALIPANEVDICILEEPEHLNWYRAPGESWTRKFKHVVGILHTNYFQYAMDQPAAIIRAPGMRLLCSWMCRAHCHRIIKLSGTIDKVAPDKELVENVHGVRGSFLEIGEEVNRRLLSFKPDPVFASDAKPTIYFIGKMLWSKGLGSLIELLKYAEESAGINVKVDMYGGGPDLDAAKDKAESIGLNMPFHGPLDHAELGFSHKIFVNPSTSEVLCTTSAEALAMGKFVILPSHVSNDFFAQFPNCLSYASKDEFVGNLFYAMTHSPKPLSAEYLEALSWRAATKRLEAAGCIPATEAEQMEELHSSKDGGVEIPLPALIEDEKRLKQISTTFRFTRHRFRQFRSRLSTEIRQTVVLPEYLRELLADSLERKLDIDIDEILESPKLRLQLSPAELDKSLLDLYESISKGPSGDVLRVIGGGGLVGMQNMYMRRQALKQRKKGKGEPDLDLFPFDLGDLVLSNGAESDQSTSEWVRRALHRNLPSKNQWGIATRRKADSKRTSSVVDGKTPRMMLGTRSTSPPMPILATWSGLAPPATWKSRGRGTFSLLI